MAEPFVFHFTPDALGQPQVMYIADLSCACTLCGHPQLQRFYHATPFHPLTWSSVHELADQLPTKVSYDCENCGTTSTTDFVQGTVLIYGSPDHLFELYIYTDLKQNQRQYQLKLNRRLDPQVQPRFVPEAGAQYVFEQLDEETFESLTGRVFNLKLAIMTLLDEWSDDPTGGAYMQLAPGCWVFIHESVNATERMIDQVERDVPILATYTSISLTDSEPTGLATHEYPEYMHGRWTSWWPAETLEIIKAGKCSVELLVDEEAVVEAIEAAFETARLTFVIESVAGSGLVFDAITTPREEVYQNRLFVDDVLRRAVFTGITPAEAGRLTAEEIVGLLMQVWHDTP